MQEVFNATLQEAALNKLLSKSECYDIAGITPSIVSYDHLPTFAVRGATLARPEGHCLCLDADYINHCHGCKDTVRPQLLSLKHRTPPIIDEMSTRFKHRAIDLLPTVVVNDHYLRGIQFLSAEETHATRLITPFFQCGGVEGPVTMFLVVDSDEEGCWVSGR